MRSVLTRYRAVIGLRRRGLSIGPSCLVQVDDRSEIAFGPGCSIGRGSLVIALASAGGTPGRLHLGRGVGIGEYANIRASESTVTIGDRCFIAQFVSVIGANHEIGADGLPVRDRTDQGRTGVAIGDGTWIGAGAILLPGVELGPNCVVGAGAVVTRSFPAGSRVAGNPARAL